MSPDASRPDPDIVLRRVRAEDERARRAKLKIFFGFAPGVGKTYTMLESAQRLKAQGVDVVVGLIETHGRSETARLLEGLEVLRRHGIKHRSKRIDEFNLDAALARKPQVLLLDELAHANVPGTRHTKRWQDALELLAAGIDVHTTLNVQHVESLNDVIAQITRVQVRETVPDALLERADEIELVDISPEELLLRLKEGKVYLPDQAARAARHFFQRGNLLALRELALRRTAERVDEDVQAYRTEQGVEAPWPATERIMVCVGPAPASARLVRAGRRMAAGLRAPWVATYVAGGALAMPMTEVDRQRLEEHLRLAESLGATVARISGSRVSEAILSYARRNNVTRIIIGKPTHSRLRDRLRGSLLNEVVRGSREIDVHVIGGDPALDEVPPTTPSGQRSIDVAKALWAVPLVAATTGFAALGRWVLSIPDVEMLYLLAVMVSGVRLGRAASLLTATLSVLAYDFFFVPPYLTLAVSDAHHLLTFAMMFGGGVFVSTLTTRLKRQELEAVGREERTAALYSLTRDLGSALDLDEVASVSARHAAEVFGAGAAVLFPDADGGLVVHGSQGLTSALGANELGVAKWAFEHGQLAGLGTDTLPGSKVVCTPLQMGSTILGVLALSPRGAHALTAEQRAVVEAFGRQVAFAIERARLTEQARQAALRARTEQMRSTLLSSVSHDLRTPLAAITGAATSLRDDAALSSETRLDLLQAICEESERLDRLLTNLLDMTRLDAGAIQLHREWVPLEETVGSALTRMESALADRPVETALPSDLPLISVDPVLLEQLLFNLLDNAVKHAPVGTPIRISAVAEEREIIIDVADRGPGIPAGEEERIFERFHRAAPNLATGGVGLGLAICRGIAHAHDGTLTATNRPGGGARFRLTLPLLEGAPVQGEETSQEGIDA